MGDPFFVINRMRAIWEHLHSKVCSYARLCKVVLIFKSVNGTPLMSEFHIVRIAKRRVLYRFFKWNLTWNTQVQLWIFLESHSLLFKWRNPCFIYVCVNVSIFNVRSRKAILVESTVKTVRSQRIEIQLESENFIWTSWLANLHFQIIRPRFVEF